MKTNKILIFFALLTTLLVQKTNSTACKYGASNVLFMEGGFSFGTPIGQNKKSDEIADKGKIVGINYADGRCADTLKVSKTDKNYGHITFACTARCCYWDPKFAEKTDKGSAIVVMWDKGDRIPDYVRKSYSKLDGASYYPICSDMRDDSVKSSSINEATIKAYYKGRALHFCNKVFNGDYSVGTTPSTQPTTTAKPTEVLKPKNDDDDDEEEERLRKAEEKKKLAEEMKRIEMDRLRRERLEQERLEREKLEQERKDKLEQERKEKLEKERLERERLEKERLEREREEKEREEEERLEKEREEKERLEQERLEREKLQRERLAKLRNSRPKSRRIRPIRRSRFWRRRFW